MDAAQEKASLLREEINFWQEMLSVIEASEHSGECEERVQQALALAQYRLALIMPQSNH